MIPILEKIKENNKRKLEHRINTFISLTGYTKIETFNSTTSDYLAVHKFIDNRNQIKFLSGYEFNNDSSLRDSIILNYNNYPTENKLAILKRFSSYDFSELLEKDFKDIDHNMLPICPDHGEFITTPRKLILGDKCKWCDGIENNEGILTYNLDRGNRINEKLYCLGLYPNLKVIKCENPYVIHIEKTVDNIVVKDCVTYDYFKDLFSKLEVNKYKAYLNYLNSVREKNYPKSIFYKINFIDKSTKFQFGLVNFLTTQIIDLDEVTDSDKIEKIILETYSEALKYFNIEIVFYSLEISLRAYFKTIQYQEENKDKHIFLPSDIMNKFPKQNYTGVITFSENSWESTSTSVRLIREALLLKSNMCPICNREINNPVVDHQHKKKIKGTGRIRNNICSNCNVFIAKIENNCTRFKIAQEELPEVLKNISDYFGAQQYNIIHYTDKESRPTLSKIQANKVLKYWEYLYPGKNKKLTYPKSGILTKDWVEALKRFEEFQNRPQISFSKNDYKLLVKKIEDFNKEAELKNMSLPKTKKIKLINIPEYPKQKLVTPEINSIYTILSNFKI